ncbi:unnamed protein product [Rotaria socialis]|uniref:Peptidase M28 domain-containing protein n=1 Tax=Rotaria socialis TaxID=392032 RepID=A0A817T527_9BILA|nr:unnamed protein product [Rotaria socialis]CAF3381621.1 unnamed protein product [Rotaria socialis]CAF3407766.1 unnamed protein product [Rotaria socialis]CAF3414286.1 unnamed protein product [Rotaria socialis]CAF3538506.1 unnamed protein product [Rotaria socialis]
MEKQVEEIVLLPTQSETQRQSENQTFLRLQTSTKDYASDEQHQHIITRLIKPTNLEILYKNLFLWVFLLGCVFLLAAPTALHFSYVLPAAKPRTIPLNEFSEERARDHYPNLTEHGPRVIHTRADYLTRAYLISQIYRIQNLTRKSIRFEISLQNFSVMDINELQNIVVRVSNPNSSYDTPCLMLTAHYDSVEFSPGGSDDGSGVVILLELLSNLVNDPTVTFTDVHLIVLFTSAEEIYLFGAEKFVTNHPWKDNVRRFINIDSTGGNEKAILFRAIPSQLVRDYGKVKRPHANVMGDEILALSGSDTDYSVFTRKGLLLGYDFAYYIDGYNYHTMIDKPSIVESGALQHLGENTLMLSRNILLGHVNLRQPKTIIDDDNVIYFDILGLHLVSYTISTSVIIQSILIGFVVLIGILMILIDHIWYNENANTNDFSSVYFYFKYPLVMRILSIILFFICYLLSILIGILFALGIAFIMWHIRPLSWYGNSTLAFFLYGLPCLIGIILCEALWTCLRRFLLSKYPKRNPMELNTINHINRLCFNFERHWALLLIFVCFMSISICTGIRSLYIILLWSIFICPIYLLLILCEFYCRWMKKKIFTIFNEQGWYWLFAPYIISLIPLTHTLEMTSRIVRLAIPIMGRMMHPMRIPQDFIICVIIIIPAVLFFLVFIPNIQRMMNYSRTLIILMISFFIVFLVAYTRQAFTNTHPKLIQVRHTSQTIYSINNSMKPPMMIPVYSKKAFITIQSFDNLVLTPTLDEISSKTGYLLNNILCSTTTKCSFDDTSNRTKPFREVELTSMDNFNNYRFTIRHSSSYFIGVTPSMLTTITVHNSMIKPRTETIIDAQIIKGAGSFDLELKLERCDLNDSPFLVSLTEKLPHIVLLGGPRCRAITDVLILSVYR